MQNFWQRLLLFAAHTETLSAVTLCTQRAQFMGFQGEQKKATFAIDFFFPPRDIKMKDVFPNSENIYIDFY